MRYRRYGTDPIRGETVDNTLFYAGTVAAVGYGLYTMRGSATRYMKQVVEKDVLAVTHSMDWAAYNLKGKAKDAAIGNIKSILEAPVTGWREAATMYAANHPVAKAMEFASEYIQPIKILDNILKLPELRYAARNQFKELTGREVLARGIADGKRLLYIRGNVYSLEKSGYLTKQIENVYVSKGAFASVLKNIDRTRTIKPATGTLLQKLRYHLDVGYGGSKKTEHPMAFMAGLFKDEDEFKDTGVELIKRFEPLKIMSDLIADIERRDYKRAFSRLNPGRSVSVFGYNFDLPAESMSEISAVHLMPYHLLNRMNVEISKQKGLKWFALSDYSNRSFADLYLSIGLKRVLPVYAGIEMYKYANWKMQQYTGKDFGAHGGDILANTALDFASIKDELGVTDLLKRAMQIAPETVSHIAHPLTDQPVGLSHDELQEYLTKGREPIRKGRWWLFGSGNALRGDSVEYFAPSWYQRTQHKYKDYAYTGVRYGSKEEYFKYGTWMPSLDYPLAPVHRLLNPYYFEKRNYESRPYPMTGELFANNIFGWPLNQTLGRIIKPQARMHRSELNQAMRSLKTINEKIVERFREDREDRLHYMYITPGGQITPMEAQPPPGAPGSSPMGGYQSTIAEAASSGDLRRLNEETKRVKPGSYGKYAAQETLRQINKLIGEKGYRDVEQTEGKNTYSQILLNARYPRPEDVYGETPYSVSKIGLLRNVGHGVGKLFESVRETAGIYGFLADTGLTRTIGKSWREGPVLESSKIGSLENTYRDLNAGSIDPWGGAFAEIMRRFIPKRRFGHNEVNPITNMMPGWLPGENYFMNFKQGDPYSKISMGEVRLPGEAYEKSHGFNISDLTVRGSMLGKSTEEIFQYILGMRSDSTYGEDRILKGGTEAHRKLQKQFQKQGILIEAEREIEDTEHHLTGHIDAIVKGQHGKEIVEIKTKGNAEALARLKAPEQSHVEQLMFYMHTTGIRKGYLHYATRDDPINGPKKIFRIDYDEKIFRHSLEKVEIARENVRKLLRSKLITPGDLYSPMDRFRILADVAPYSKEYEYYKGFLSRELEEGSAEREEFSNLKREVTELKKKVDITPYRFRDAAIEKKTYLVQKVIAPGVIKFFGLKNPVKMAGLQVFNNDAKEGRAAKDYMGENFGFLAPITLGIARDKSRRVENDAYGSIHAAMWNMTGVNLNQELVERGGAKEKESDYRPAAVHARFSRSEILAGKLAEGASHINIPYIHNKFMPVNSAIEEYERKEIYGKKFTRWTHPISDMIVPAIRTYASEGPIVGALYGGFLGAVLATPKHRILVAGVGAVIGATAGFLMNLRGRDSHIPGSVKRRRNLEEYFDRLKYIKFKRLYEAARKKIKQKEHIDIESLARHFELEGIDTKHRRQYLTDLKRKDKAEGVDVKPLNRKLKRIASNRRRVALTPLDSRALQFREQYKATMYGLDIFGAYANIYRALPKKERDYYNEFAEAPERERKRILRIVPKDVGRLLKAKWTGKEPEKMQTMEEYFKDKYLPEKDWIGWTQEHALEDYKMVTLMNDGGDMQQEDYWPSDMERAREQRIKDIRPFTPGMFKVDIASRLRRIMKSAGFKDIDVKINTVPCKGGHKINVSGNILQDRSSELNAIINDPDFLNERIRS